MNTANIENTNNTNTISTSSNTASVGEKLGEFYPYDSANPPLEASDSRICKIIVRNRKGAETDTSGSKYVRVPNAHITEDSVTERLDDLIPYFVDYLIGIEDSMIREDYKKGITSIYTEGLSLQKIIDKLESEESGSRLNSEVIADWFEKEVREYLQLAFADKLDISPDDMKLVPVLEAYLTKFKSLASPKVSYVEEDRTAMLKVLEASEAKNSTIGKKIVKRLEAMKEKETDLLLSL